MGSHFLETLKGITIFLLAGQLILRLLPEGGYEKYARILIGVMALSRLALPLLSLGGFDAGQVFADALAEYGRELADIETQVEQAGLEEGGFVQEGLLSALSERLGDFFAQEGIGLVSAAFDEDGVLHMTVAALPQAGGEEGAPRPESADGEGGALRTEDADGEGGAPRPESAGGEENAGRIEVEPVRIGDGQPGGRQSGIGQTEDGKPGSGRSGIGQENAGALSEPAGAQERLPGLREAIADRLQMEPEKLEVNWDE
ncbi:MAG TPA: hypothetical protein H9831_08315 [Candidatus Eisenbergiella pullistercoris]|uniref:Stage III sporulation protein AF n=1 Tax=Candidatus Eisenbergiella pullistercoris TaxID=2838555 RepID=A0A9D1YQH1_9FIRM|nr:hypothetical protein [Candidatus Eisenbergiella pullistercoris]